MNTRNYEPRATHTTTKLGTNITGDAKKKSFLGEMFDFD